MKSRKYLVLAGMALLLLPWTMFGKEKNQANMNLDVPVLVGSTRLEPGSYKVEWSGTKPEVHVKILQHDKTVAVTSAQLVSYSNPDDAVVTDPPPANMKTRTLKEIDFARRKEALQLNAKGSK